MTTTTPTLRATGVYSAEPTRWRIDPARSRLQFRTPTFWGHKLVEGRFERYDGTLDLGREPAIELTIDAGSLNTNNRLRDRHLRDEHFFDVEKHPEVRFVADSATLAGSRLTVRGQLYAAGRSLPLHIEGRVARVGDELTIDARAQADHEKLGMTHSPLGMIRTPSELIVHARLVRDAGDGRGLA